MTSARKEVAISGTEISDPESDSAGHNSPCVQGGYRSRSLTHQIGKVAPVGDQSRQVSTDGGQRGIAIGIVWCNVSINTRRERYQWGRMGSVKGASRAPMGDKVTECQIKHVYRQARGARGWYQLFGGLDMTPDIAKTRKLMRSLLPFVGCFVQHRGFTRGLHLFLPMKWYCNL